MDKSSILQFLTQMRQNENIPQLIQPKNRSCPFADNNEPDDDMSMIVFKLINTSENKECCDKDGNNHLHHLVNQGNARIVKQYILTILNNSNKKNILNKKNNQGNTPLHIAVKRNFQIIADLLVQAGADTNLSNKKNMVVKYVPGNYPTDSPRDETSNKLAEMIFNNHRVFNQMGGSQKKTVYKGKRKV